MQGDPRDLDNLSWHKTNYVDAFLQAHPDVQSHFTPTYASWLNQMELLFAQIECDIIPRWLIDITCWEPLSTGEFVSVFHSCAATVRPALL